MHLKLSNVILNFRIFLLYYNLFLLITVKLEMFADINVCEFAILKVFTRLKFAILVLPKVNFVFPTSSVLLLLLLIGYIRCLVLFMHINNLQVTG